MPVSIKKIKVCDDCVDKKQYPCHHIIKISYSDNTSIKQEKSGIYIAMLYLRWKRENKNADNVPDHFIQYI